MTRKVYYDDGTCFVCDATLLQCREEADGYALLLDRTVIFPEGGGQPSDTGSIDGVAVTAAYEEGENIWHRVDAPVEAGKTVRVCVDAARRMDHTRQHTGEHIVSGLASKLFGAHNVGFHMAETYSTLDLDMALDAEQLAALEREANRVVQANTPVTYRFVEAEALEGMTLRKQAKGLSGDVRIVYIGDTDSCTCCGTHCTTTGEVGLIGFTAWQNYKGGIRLWFACGMRAVEAGMARRDALDGLAKRFSTSEEDVCTAVLRQGDELNEARRALRQRTAQWLDYKTRELLAEAETVGKTRLVLHSEAGLGAPDLKLFAEKLAAEHCVAVLFAPNGEVLNYQLASSPEVSLSMREVCSAVNAATGGRGGGKDHFAQGSAKYTAALPEILEQLRTYLRAVLRGG